MGKDDKRKRKLKSYDKDDEIWRKMRRLEKELRRSRSHERERKRRRSRSVSRHRSLSRSPRSRSRSLRHVDSRSPSYSEHSPTPSFESYWSDPDPSGSPIAQSTDMVTNRTEPDRAENYNPIIVLDKDILEALGDPKSKDEVFGPQIPDELSKRWDRILTDGLAKEQREEILEKILVPDNFRLVKAPLLNPEIAPVLSDTVRNRDKILEKSQDLLGMGIASLTQLTSSIITSTDNLNKIEIVKKLSEVSQILLELHHHDTLSRRKLIMSSLDKKFTNTIKDVKRDEFLFGSNLGEKIKALKIAEKSGMQIKRQDGSSTKRSSQGNWRGQPRSSGPGQRGHKWSGQRGRHSNNNGYQGSRRPAAAATDRSTQGGKAGPSKSKS